MKINPYAEEQWKILIRAYLPNATFSETRIVYKEFSEFIVSANGFIIRIVFAAEFRSPFFQSIEPWDWFGYEDLNTRNLIERLKYINQIHFGE